MTTPSTLPAVNAPAETSQLSSRHLLYLLVAAAMFAVTALLIAATWLLEPNVVPVLGAFWLLALAMAVRSWRRGPWAPLGWSVLVAVVWVAIVAVGVTAWDWRS